MKSLILTALCLCCLQSASAQIFGGKDADLNGVLAKVEKESANKQVVLNMPIDVRFEAKLGRNWKSGYAQTDSKAKVEFATAYDKFLRTKGETVAELYPMLPNCDRGQFARSYWTQHSQAFKDLDESAKELWARESILDAAILIHLANLDLSNTLMPARDCPELLHLAQYHNAVVPKPKSKQDALFIVPRWNAGRSRNTPGPAEIEAILDSYDKELHPPKTLF